MKTPKYLMPFVYIWRLICFPFWLIIHLLKWFFIGIFTTIWTIISLLVNAIIHFIKYLCYGFVYSFIVGPKMVGKTLRYFTNGFIVLSFLIYKIFKYIVYGLYFPIVIISDFLRNKKLKHDAKTESIREAKRKELERKQKEKISKKLAKDKALEKRVKDKLAKEEKEKQLKEQLEKNKNDHEAYVNENADTEKQVFNSRISQFLAVLGNLPERMKQGISNWYNNLTFVKNKRNRFEMEHQELLINFEGEDAEKSAEKIPYEYVIKTPEGKMVKGHYEAFSKVEVHSFLLSEGNEVYSIRTSPLIQLLYKSTSKSGAKFKTKDLVFFLTQLSTYIKAGIPLVDSLRILARQYKKKSYKQTLRNVIYELTMGEIFSEALSKQGDAFPRLLINMVKTSELTGELPETLDDMANYYTEMDTTRKQMITAMMYPCIILVISIAVIAFVLIWVVPQFTGIYATIDNAQIPKFTLMIVAFSAFLEKNGIMLLVGLLVTIIVVFYLYKNIKSFRSVIQWVLMHTPVIKNVIIYNEVTMFTKTFASLLKHNVFITDSMEILNKVTNNEIYKMIILDTISNLAHGDKLSLSFKDHWAFPIPAYEMLVTGEQTGQLPEMMQKVSEYYQELHKNSVARIKTFIEPILIILLTVVVGVIVLAVIIPMFSLYRTIQGTAV